MARTSFLVKFELDFKEKRCPICQDLQPSLLCTPPTWSTQHHGDQVHHGGPHVPLLSGLNHNNRLKPQAVPTTMYDSLQPCKADHHHGWGHGRGSGINMTTHRASVSFIIEDDDDFLND